jgi:ABC-type transport system substrate-binding protein
MKRMPDSPERNELIERMVKLIIAYAPWHIETYKAQNILVQPWLLGYRKHPFAHEPWKYLDVDLERRARP